MTPAYPRASSSNNNNEIIRLLRHARVKNHDGDASVNRNAVEQRCHSRNRTIIVYYQMNTYIMSDNTQSALNVSNVQDTARNVRR